MVVAGGIYALQMKGKSGVTPVAEYDTFH
ncbi:antibiotic efflux protein [Shigella flexneri]|nr:antibiotic efflux protein [Shigella flexneri]